MSDIQMWIAICGVHMWVVILSPVFLSQNLKTFFKLKI